MEDDLLLAFIVLLHRWIEAHGGPFRLEPQDILLMVQTYPLGATIERRLVHNAEGKPVVEFRLPTVSTERSVEEFLKSLGINVYLADEDQLP